MTTLNVWGIGQSRVPAVRNADFDSDAMAMARARGFEPAREEAYWAVCVEVDESDLDMDPATIGYGSANA